MAFSATKRFCSSAIKDVGEYFHYTRAIIGSLNNSFSEHSLKMEPSHEEIDLMKAQTHHKEYVDSLKKLIGNQIVQVPANDAYPDQVFVEDPAIVCDGKAFVTNVKMPSRRGEKAGTMIALQSLGLPIYEMKDPGAYLDGGDVLFTGREFFIGLSSRSNKEGIEEFARCFSNWPVSAVKLPEGTGALHLKSVCSLCNIDTIAVGDTPFGRLVWKGIEASSKFKYKPLWFPDNSGANCLFVNGVVLHPAKEDCPGSYDVWQTLECEKVPLRIGELRKADGCLTCCSILIN